LKEKKGKKRDSQECRFFHKSPFSKFHLSHNFVITLEECIELIEKGKKNQRQKEEKTLVSRGLAIITSYLAVKK